MPAVEGTFGFGVLGLPLAGEAVPASALPGRVAFALALAAAVTSVAWVVGLLFAPPLPLAPAATQPGVEAWFPPGGTVEAAAPLAPAEVPPAEPAVAPLSARG
jgi:hypothetical protein